MAAESTAGSSPGTAARKPQCDFAHFLVTLGNTALVHLGEVRHPGEDPEVNVHLARHTVDVLRLLKAKTAGNLDEDEQRLIDALLDELGPKVAAAESGGASA